MAFQSALSPMSPDDRYQYGAAVARDAAFDAVYGLWQRRRSEKDWIQKKAAESIGVDDGWLSKQFRGPRNWTMETFGALIQALDGDVEVIVKAIEDVANGNGNYDAYAEMDDLNPSPKGGLRQLRVDDKPPQATDGTRKLELQPSQ